MTIPMKKTRLAWIRCCTSPVYIPYAVQEDDVTLSWPLENCIISVWLNAAGTIAFSMN